MYKLVEYREENRTDWNEFAMARGSVFHLIEFKEILEETFGYKGLYYMVFDSDNQIAGLVPVITGRNLMLKRSGVSLPFVNYLDVCCRDEEVFSFITGELERLRTLHKLSYIELRLKNDHIKADDLALNSSNYTLVIPLDGDEEHVLSHSTSSNRNHVRKVYKNNYFSVSFDRDNLKEFYKIYCMTMKRLGSPAPDISLFRLAVQKLPENTVLLSVLDNESSKLVGGMFLFTFGDAVYYQWGGSLTEYNRKYINNFMYWEAVKFGIRNGYKRLDLGRSPYNSGTYRFKEQWGAVPEQLKYYRFGAVKGEEGEVDRERLGPFIALWKIMPYFFTDFAGKIIIRNIMP